VADGGGLENRYGVTPIVGSNPTPSALTSGFVLPEELRRGASGAAVRSRARTVRGPARSEAPETGRDLGVAPLGRVPADHGVGRPVAGTSRHLGHHPRSWAESQGGVGLSAVTAAGNTSRTSS
jgi:hypothetical protein